MGSQYIPLYFLFIAYWRRDRTLFSREIGDESRYRDDYSYNSRNEDTNRNVDVGMDSAKSSYVETIRNITESGNKHDRPFQRVERVGP